MTRVFRELPWAMAGQEDPVHQVRVAGRRLRVALPLLAGKGQRRRVRKALDVLRQLTRAVGAGRDMDVLLGLFDDRLAILEAPSAEQRALLSRLRSARPPAPWPCSTWARVPSVSSWPSCRLARPPGS